MRPQRIKDFQWLYLIGSVAPIVAIMTNYQLLRAQAIAKGTAPGGPMMTVLFSIVVDFLLWYFIVRRASNIAKWIMVVFTALSLLLLPWEFGRAKAIGLEYLVLYCIGYVAWTVATVVLFQRDVSLWLKSRGQISSVDPAIFT